MPRFTISPSKSQKIAPIQSSFSFNYGKATVRLDPNGTYTLLVDGSTFSEYVNSARRAPQYRSTVQKVSEQMVKAYERETELYTKLTYNLSPTRTRKSIETLLNGLELKRYSEAPFPIPKPLEQDVQKELEAEAEQLFFRTFGRDTQAINEYVDSKFQQAYNDRLAAWNELSAFHDSIQAQNADRQNQLYYNEYSTKKEELENILNGPSSFVDLEIQRLLGSFQLPMAIDLEYSYNRTKKRLVVELEVPDGNFIPFEKASVLSSGKVSIKKKPIKEWKEEMAYCIYGLPYYVASILFNASTNIETIDITIWEVGRMKGYMWIAFDRDEFGDFIAHNTIANPIYYITKWPHYSSIEYHYGGITSVEGDPRSLFLMKVKKEKQLLENSVPINSSGNRPLAISTSQGDLNPDPIILTISEAHILSKEVEDPSIERAIINAVWAGETTVAVDRKYAEDWERVRKEVYRK